MTLTERFRNEEMRNQKAAAFDQMQQQAREQQLLNTPAPGTNAALMAAYEQGMAEQAARLANLQQFNGMQAQYQQDPGMRDAVMYENQLRLQEAAQGPRPSEFAPTSVENIGYAEAVKRGLVR